MALKKVTGTECLKYINKPIGFGSHDYCIYGNMSISTLLGINALRVEGQQYNHTLRYNPSMISTHLYKWYHNANQRVVGLVLDKSPDGGLEVAILGSEQIANIRGQMEWYETRLFLQGNYVYELPVIPLPEDEWKLTTIKMGTYIAYGEGNPRCYVQINNNTTDKLTLDQAIDYDPIIDKYIENQSFGCIWEYAGQLTGQQAYTLTHDKHNTMVVGTILDVQDAYPYLNILKDDPLRLLGGDLYSAMGILNFNGESGVPVRIPQGTDFDSLKFSFLDVTNLNRTNLTSIPYNIILTENEQYAQAYLSNGTLPPDAFLFPLDWDDLPRYNPEDDPDDDDNPDDDDDDGDNGRDVDPTPLTAPIVTPQMLDANNVYWLGVGEYGQFLTWFWFDIQQFSVLDPTTWDNLSDNILGLYNNLAETVVAVRFMPLKPEWVGGLNDTKEPIKLGMIQDYRTHDVFNKYAQLEPRLIGSIDIPNKFNNYKYLNLSPYSQLSLYLPFYGFADLDIDMFTGHKLTVYAVYDILSGSIVYYVYYDDTALVNYYMAKISVDVPITLQTAYDRDRAMNQNITESIVNGGSLLTSIVGGNPIGMTLAAGNLASAPSASAPMLVKGYGSEQGILFTPSKCAIYLRRPTTVKKGSAFKSTVGNLWCRTARLSNLSGFTQCQNPHITFRGNTYVTEEGETTDKKLLPLAEEIEEIYDYLTKGVIL